MKLLGVMFLITVYLEEICGFLEEDYSWRDFSGQIPSDAFQAGYDKSGKPIYIGQVLFENKLIPGKIYSTEPNIYFEYGQVFTKNETIKILCAQHPEKFQWVKIRYDGIRDEHNLNFFEGGYEEGFFSYVGRAKTHGELSVGKVMCWKTNCYRLTTVNDGKWDDHDEFEILTYDSNMERVE